MIPLLLLGVFVACAIGSWASYTDRVRQSNYYVGLMAWLGVTVGLLFACGCQYLNAKPRIFVFSLGYDVVVAFCYYVLPVLFFSCRLTPGVMVGAGLILLGLLIIHTAGG